MVFAAAFVFLMVPQAVEPEEASVGILKAWIGLDTALINPEFQRITDAETWLTFWQKHAPGSKKAPQVHLDSHLVLVIPATIPAGDTLLPPSPTGATGVQAWISEKSLRVQVLLATKPAKKGAPPRTVLTIVAVPVSPLPVEVRLQVGGATTTTTHPGVAVAAVAGRITLKGPLGWSSVEGGAWTFTDGGKKYDLHLVPPGFNKGDLVEIVGREPTGTKCFHGWGTIFWVETIRQAK